MIAFIRGKLAGVLNGSILLDVGGIGYEIQVPLNLLKAALIEEFHNPAPVIRVSQNKAF
jgi:Holliday junction resolvasome RuvABC DNA-binding subunit